MRVHRMFAVVVAMATLAIASTHVLAARLPNDILDRIDRAELGDQFDPASAPQFHALHELIEQYFTAPSSADRSNIAQQIHDTNISPSIIGRLCRIRMDWAPLAGGVYYIKDKVGPFDVRYFLGIPANYDVTRSWPLVVKLPTPDAFLTDPPPDGNRVSQIYTQWATDELATHPDAIVLMPLLNLDRMWGPGPLGMNMVMQPILDAAGKANIDPARVYLIGHSTSAHATWNIALHYPTYFAAINPLAGSANQAWQRIRLGNLRNVLPVVWHDASDDIVNVRDSRELVRYLRNLKYEIDYMETKSVGHVPSPQIVEQEYQKLRARTRPLYPKEVFVQSDRMEAVFNRVDWVQLYQPLRPGDDIKMLFTSGGEQMTLYQNSFRVVANIEDNNTISLKTTNVATARIYLNDQMVDFSRPVRLVINGKPRYEHLVQQDVEEMLKDQLFLGRGWRYFTAMIDLDMAASPSSRPATASSAAPATQSTHHGTIEFDTPDGEHKIYSPPSQ